MILSPRALATDVVGSPDGENELARLRGYPGSFLSDVVGGLTERLCEREPLEAFWADSVADGGADKDSRRLPNARFPEMEAHWPLMLFLTTQTCSYYSTHMFNSPNPLYAIGSDKEPGTWPMKHLTDELRGTVKYGTEIRLNFPLSSQNWGRRSLPEAPFIYRKTCKY